MKKLISLIVVFALVQGLFATDFVLKSGRTVIGKLKGIQEGHMYVLAADNQVNVLAFNDISVVNDGNGDVSIMWKRKKPFMDADLANYTLVNPDKQDQLYATMPLTPVPIQPKPTSVELSNQHLKSISSALWFMNGMIALSLIGGIVLASSK